MLPFKTRTREVFMISIMISVIFGAGFQGMHLIESTKVQSVAQQFQDIRLCVEEYVTKYGKFPGKRNVYETLDDTKAALCHMHEKGCIRSKEFIKSKMGGVFVFKTINGKHHVQLLSGAPLLTRRQIMKITRFLNMRDTSSYVIDNGVFSFPLSE